MDSDDITGYKDSCYACLKGNDDFSYKARYDSDEVDSWSSPKGDLDRLQQIKSVFVTVLRTKVKEWSGAIHSTGKKGEYKSEALRITNNETMEDRSADLNWWSIRETCCCEKLNCLSFVNWTKLWLRLSIFQQGHRNCRWILKRKCSAKTGSSTLVIVKFAVTLWYKRFGSVTM